MGKLDKLPDDYSGRHFACSLCGSKWITQHLALRCENNNCYKPTN